MGSRRSDLERLERGTWVFCLLFLLWKQRLLVRSHVLGGLEARPVPQSGETKDGRLLQGRHAGFWRQSLLAEAFLLYCVPRCARGSSMLTSRGVPHLTIRRHAFIKHLLSPDAVLEGEGVGCGQNTKGKGFGTGRHGLKVRLHR